MRVVVHPDVCVGTGQCVLLAGDVFSQRDEDATVVLLQPEPPEQAHSRVRQAAIMCPSVAIEVQEGT